MCQVSHFTFITSTHHHDCAMQVLIVPYYRWRNWASGRSTCSRSSFNKVAEAGFEQILLVPKPTGFPMCRSASEKRKWHFVLLLQILVFSAARRRWGLWSYLKLWCMNDGCHCENTSAGPSRDFLEPPFKSDTQRLKGIWFQSSYPFHSTTLSSKTVEEGKRNKGLLDSAIH